MDIIVSGVYGIRFEQYLHAFTYMKLQLYIASSFEIILEKVNTLASSIYWDAAETMLLFCRGGAILISYVSYQRQLPPLVLFVLILHQHCYFYLCKI